MIRSLTSDREVKKTKLEYLNEARQVLFELITEKDMVIIVDENRFKDIEVGDQINIHLEVIK